MLPQEVHGQPQTSEKAITDHMVPFIEEVGALEKGCHYHGPLKLAGRGGVMTLSTIAGGPHNITGGSFN